MAMILCSTRDARDTPVLASPLAILTIGHVLPVLDRDPPESELGLEPLRRVAERVLGSDGLPWYVSYRVRVAVK
jgi:hypothetical protein